MITRSGRVINMTKAIKKRKRSAKKPKLENRATETSGPLVIKSCDSWTQTLESSLLVYAPPALVTNGTQTTNNEDINLEPVNGSSGTLIIRLVSSQTLILPSHDTQDINFLDVAGPSSQQSPLVLGSKRAFCTIEDDKNYIINENAIVNNADMREGMFYEYKYSNIDLPVIIGELNDIFRKMGWDFSVSSDNPSSVLYDITLAKTSPIPSESELTTKWAELVNELRKYFEQKERVNWLFQANRRELLNYVSDDINNGEQSNRINDWYVLPYQCWTTVGTSNQFSIDFSEIENNGGTPNFEVDSFNPKIVAVTSIPPSTW